MNINIFFIFKACRRNEMFKMRDKSIYKVILSPVLYFRIRISPTVVILLDAQQYIIHPAKYAWPWHIWNWGWLVLWDIFEVIVKRYSYFFYYKQHNSPSWQHFCHMCTHFLDLESCSSFHGVFGDFGWVREFLMRPSGNSYLKSKTTLTGLFVPSLSWYSMTKALWTATSTSWKRTWWHPFTVFLIQE